MRRNLKQIAHFFQHRIDQQNLVTHAAVDSRCVKEGSIFFAIKGEKSNGHDFLEEVSKKGGVAAVVSKNYRGKDFGMPLISVSNVKESLQTLAKEVFSEKSPTTLCVTGSAGKTTTKEFIVTLLSEKFHVAKNEGNRNSQLGIPLTLLNWNGDEEIFVLEMGMSQPGELTRLTNIAPPHIGVLTNIHYQHSQFFPDLEGIAKEKCEVFNSPKMKQGFLNLQTQHFKSVKKLNVPKAWYHLYDSQADFTLNNLKVPLPFKETHLQENFLAATLVARYFGLNWEEISIGSKKISPYKHRFQKIIKKGILFIDDSYNASPISVKVALLNLPKRNRKIGFLSDMGELGKFSIQSHIEVGECAVKVLDHLICIGKGCLEMVKIFKRKGKNINYFETKEEAVCFLKEIITEGDVVLIKGRNVLKLWTIIEGF